MVEEFGWKKDKYWERTRNKRALRQKKLKSQKQAWFTWQQLASILWEDFTVKAPKKGVDIWVVCWLRLFKDWKLFQILDIESRELIESLLDPEIPQELWDQIVIWDMVIYIKKWWKYIILKRNNRENKISRLKWDAERFSFWKRVEQVIAANIDIGVIVASAKDPDFHSNFIDRYNIILQYWWVKPLICITKSDLKELDNPILRWYREKLWIPVVYCSTVTWEWIDELKSQIQWKTVVLVWNSGVWKSSLINYLEGNWEIKTQTVSDKTWQWRHTTTSSALYEWADHSFIIDTPWIRSLELLEIWRDELKDYFPEFDELSINCKFNDCSHTHEPICWVKNAVENWQLSKERYENYLRILNDLI